MASNLLLTVNKGPKAGETIACKPGTVIRIGRVVRGNTLAIKDPGISQKHLTVCFLPGITRWVVTDLGSSNGIYINGSLISSEEPSSLSDGDVIKIGERTSISVTISAIVDQPHVLPRCEPSKNGQRARGRGRKGGRSTCLLGTDEALESVVVERRVTRSLARAGSTRVFVNVKEKEKQSKENNDRREDEVVAMDGENNSRVEELKNNMDAISKENNARVEEEVLDVDGENNSSVEEVEDNMNGISKVNNARVEEEVLTVDGKHNPRVEEVDDNMNNMTLGQWFDRMEEYLPKAINKVAEEIIDKLREKAHFFDEYVVLVD